MKCSRTKMAPLSAGGKNLRGRTKIGSEAWDNLRSPNRDDIGLPRLERHS